VKWKDTKDTIDVSAVERARKKFLGDWPA